MKKRKLHVVDIDFMSHVVFTDMGCILEIENYVDSNEMPCLPEEATHAYVRTGTTSFAKIKLAEVDNEFDQDYQL